MPGIRTAAWRYRRGQPRISATRLRADNTGYLEVVAAFESATSITHRGPPALSSATAMISFGRPAEIDLGQVEIGQDRADGRRNRRK